MKMKAAVLHATNTPLVVEEINIDDPKPGEVRVKIEATGFCHTDLKYYKGEMGGPMPMVPGHEGAGIVEKVGEGVTTLQVGDHVVMGVIVPCGKCSACISGRSYMCENCAQPMLSGVQLEGSSRLSNLNGEPIYHTFCQGSFAEYCVAGEFAVAKVRDDVPLDKVCALGCAMGHGIGSVINNPHFKIEPGDKVAVIGCGTVGLSAIMGAKLCGCSHIVAIDVLDNKLEMAKEVGATMTINAKTKNPAMELMCSIGSVDYAFECVGVPALVNMAFDLCHMVGGTVVIAGAMPMGAMVEFEGFYFTCAKSIIGVGGGFMRPKFDIPRYVELYKAGLLPLDKLVTHHFKLEDINKAIDALVNGESIKSVIVP